MVLFLNISSIGFTNWFKGKTLQYYGITKARDPIFFFNLIFASNNQVQGDTVHLILRLIGGGDDYISITIKMPNGSIEHLSAEQYKPVSVLKKKISKRTGISVAMQVLSVDGRILDDGMDSDRSTKLP